MVVRDPTTGRRVFGKEAARIEKQRSRERSRRREASSLKSFTVTKETAEVVQRTINPLTGEVFDTGISKPKGSKVVIKKGGERVFQ